MMPQKLAHHCKDSESLWSYQAQNFTVSGECLTRTHYTLPLLFPQQYQHFEAHIFMDNVHMHW